jgi:hypothetical protein
MNASPNESHCEPLEDIKAKPWLVSLSGPHIRKSTLPLLLSGLIPERAAERLNAAGVLHSSVLTEAEADHRRLFRRFRRADPLFVYREVTRRGWPSAWTGGLVPFVPPGCTKPVSDADR